MWERQEEKFNQDNGESDLNCAEMWNRHKWRSIELCKRKKTMHMGL